MIYSMLSIVRIYIFLYIRICLQVSTSVYNFLEVRYALKAIQILLLICAAGFLRIKKAIYRMLNIATNRVIFFVEGCAVDFW